jgi:hypothetical protein
MRSSGCRARAADSRRDLAFLRPHERNGQHREHHRGAQRALPVTRPYPRPHLGSLAEALEATQGATMTYIVADHFVSDSERFWDGAAAAVPIF